jgi:hypothetical protein
VDSDILEHRLQQAFSKRIRLAAENSAGRLSSVWMFWSNRNDFYFGAKSLSDSFKVSLHENGIGYVAYHKSYLLEKRAQGIDLPNKTVLEWKLPVPAHQGAVHAASVILPSNYCRSGPLSDKDRSKTLVFEVEDNCATEIGVFLSKETHETLEAKFLPIGHPIFMINLENGLRVSIVARSREFDPAVLPSNAQVQSAKSTSLVRPDQPAEHADLNAMLWNDPGDGGALQVIDIGGVRVTDKA